MIRTDRGMLEGRVLIASSEPHPDCAGRDLEEIAAEWGVAKDEAARRLQPGSAIYFLMDEGDVRNILAFDETMIGSDGIPAGERPHPRLWATFPRVLGHYSRDVGLFPLETAVWKMTGLTARNFGLTGRGTLGVGQHADVVVFDAATIRGRGRLRVAEAAGRRHRCGDRQWRRDVARRPSFGCAARAGDSPRRGGAARQGCGDDAGTGLTSRLPRTSRGSR